MITVKQIKAARALLGWKQSDLAKRCGYSLPAINNIEREISTPKSETLEVIKQCFEENGIEFNDQTGVNLKGEQLRILKLDGTEGLQKLLDDVYSTLQRETQKEVLIFGVNEKQFSQRLGKNLKAHIERLKKADISERLLISESDDFLVTDKKSYRRLPQDVFSETPFYVYSNKCAFVLWGPPLRIILIQNTALSESFHKQFEFNWNQASPL